MNEIILMGRITKDLEVRQTTTGLPVLQFTMAVDRPGKDKQTDFINCVAWRQTAEFIARYFGKGRLILVTGRLQIRSYEDRDGNKRTAAEVIVNEAHFTGERRETNVSGPQSGFDEYQGKFTAQGQGTPQSAGQGAYMDGFEEVLSDDGVPF